MGPATFLQGTTLLLADYEAKLHFLREGAEAAGAEVVVPGCGREAQCTLVVTACKTSSWSEYATRANKGLVSPWWLWQSLEAGLALPLNDDVLFAPFVDDVIPGGAACQVTLTGFQGPVRQMLLAMMRWMGLVVQTSMNPVVTTHVVAKDVDEKSAKLNAARQPEYSGRISIVNVDWVLDSLRQWRLLPTDNYLRNVASNSLSQHAAQQRADPTSSAVRQAVQGQAGSGQPNGRAQLREAGNGSAPHGSSQQATPLTTVPETAPSGPHNSTVPQVAERQSPPARVHGLTLSGLLGEPGAGDGSAIAGIAQPYLPANPPPADGQAAPSTSAAPTRLGAQPLNGADFAERASQSRGHLQADPPRSYSPAVAGGPAAVAPGISTSLVPASNTHIVAGTNTQIAAGALTALQRLSGPTAGVGSPPAATSAALPALHRDGTTEPAHTAAAPTAGQTHTAQPRRAARQPVLPWETQPLDAMTTSNPSECQIAAAHARTSKLLSELAPASSPSSRATSPAEVPALPPAGAPPPGLPTGQPDAQPSNGQPVSRIGLLTDAAGATPMNASPLRPAGSAPAAAVPVDNDLTDAEENDLADQEPNAYDLPEQLPDASAALAPVGRQPAGRTPQSAEHPAGKAAMLTGRRATTARKPAPAGSKRKRASAPVGTAGAAAETSGRGPSGAASGAKGSLKQASSAQRLSALHNGQSDLVGSRISKEFDGKAYQGHVVSYDPEVSCYGVKYEDGDSEELSSQELRACLLDEEDGCEASSPPQKPVPQKRRASAQGKGAAAKGRGKRSSKGALDDTGQLADADIDAEPGAADAVAGVQGAVKGKPGRRGSKRQRISAEPAPAAEPAVEPIADRDDSAGVMEHQPATGKQKKRKLLNGKGMAAARTAVVAPPEGQPATEPDAPPAARPQSRRKSKQGAQAHAQGTHANTGSLQTSKAGVASTSKAGKAAAAKENDAQRPDDPSAPSAKAKQRQPAGRRSLAAVPQPKVRASPVARQGTKSPAEAKAVAALASVSPTQRGRRPFFALSGMHRDEQERCVGILRELHVGVLSGRATHRWEARVTHVVAPGLLRSAKMLAGMAAGNWILGSSYLDECKSACRLVEPEPHELQESSNIAVGTPKHWRTRHKELGRGAFAGLRVVVHGTLDKETGPDRDHIIQIVEAGGGSIVTLAEAITASCGGGAAQVAIMRADKPKGDAGVKKLLAAHVACARPQYIVEWVADPWGSLKEHMLFGCKPGAEMVELKQERGKGLPALEVSQAW